MQMARMGGHSGCGIFLCETRDNQSFVRKISRDLGYNRRLELQAKKQANFKSEDIYAPSVYRTGYAEDGRFYFDMEYIRGITLAEYMKTIEIGKIRVLVETILNNIINDELKGSEADESCIVAKIKKLDMQLRKCKNSTIDVALDLLGKHSWKKFSRSSCHGDLTLENIIVKDGRLYFIDFLDSFYDCWLMDIGTLMQDVQTMWAYRLESAVNINTLLRLIVFRDILLDEIKRKMPEDLIEVYYSLLLKLLRIYPYAQSEQTYLFLNKKTQSVVQIIEEFGK